MEFGGFLEQWLATKGWSQNRLAAEAGVSQGLVSKWVHGDPRRRSVPSPRNLERLAPVLGLPYEDLMRMCGFLPEGTAAETARIDPDLVVVNTAWPRLSSGIREAIRILVGAGDRVSSPTSSRGSRQNGTFAHALAGEDHDDDGQNGLLSRCKSSPVGMLSGATLQARLVAVGG